MSPPGRPKGEFRSAQHEGTPVSGAARLLRVRIDRTLLDLPVASVARIGRLDGSGWSGSDAEGGPLLLSGSDHGPLVAVAANLLLKTAAVSPQPAWGVVLAGEDEPLLAAAVCDVIGLVAPADAPQSAPHDA